MKNNVLLLTALSGAALDRAVKIFSPVADVVVVTTREQLEAAPIDKRTTLVSFGSGAIVSKHALQKFFRPAYNLHAASPEFPGRDPHHHAVYRAAKIYGATLHVMTDQVDAGPIVAVNLFEVERGVSPAKLLEEANERAFKLLEQYGHQILQDAPLPALEGAAWGPLKTTRADLIAASEITPLISEDEFARRYKAFDGGAYDNLTLELHGRTFRIDKQRPLGPRSYDTFAEFTDAGFRDLLRALKSSGYRFSKYGEAEQGKTVLWRHDLDFSVHRALKLAQIEAEEGAVATYFVNPRSAFYNFLEPAVTALLGKIRALGHDIGLHFDADAGGISRWAFGQLAEAVRRDRLILEIALDEPVKVVSWHNPDLSNLLEFDAEEVGGLINTYSARHRREYVYCSDSNGYWRFKPMRQVIAEGHPRLQLLTHPAWWTPEPLPPSDRIDRALLGRARSVRASYDEILKRGGRRNITSKKNTKNS